MRFCQSFRDERIQGRTVSFVSFHATWWRKCKEKPSQLQRTGYIHTYFIEAQWMALSRNSRDPQVSCIQLFFPTLVIGSESLQKTKSTQIMICYQEKMKCVFWRAPFCQAFRFHSKAVAYAVPLPLHLLEQVCWHFKICKKSSRE